jgi:hypothetical protein
MIVARQDAAVKLSDSRNQNAQICGIFLTPMQVPIGKLASLSQAQA